MLLFSGVSEIVFFKKFHNWTEETKDWITRRLVHGPLQHRNSPTDEPIQDDRLIWPNHPFVCPALFCLRFALAEICLCWKVCNFNFNELEILFTFLLKNIFRNYGKFGAFSLLFHFKLTSNLIGLDWQIETMLLHLIHPIADKQKFAFIWFLNGMVSWSISNGHAHFALLVM